MSKKTKKPVLRYRTIVLSDVHLGAPDCQIDKVNFFLKHTHAAKIILNGDIIDGWSLGRRGGWTQKHTRFVRLILKKIEKKAVEVIYLRGNHDDILDRFLPLAFGNLKITDQYIHEGFHRRYLVLHGDLFDTVTQHSRLTAIAGDIGYQALMRINRVYNRYRAWRGMGYFSLSKAIKARTKTVVNYISKFENQIEHFTTKAGCTGFICGHIHTPDDKMIGEVHYLNSGDWVESDTALVEHFDGRWEILGYARFREQLEKVAANPNTTVAFAFESTVEDAEQDEDATEIIVPA